MRGKSTIVWVFFPIFMTVCSAQGLTSLLGPFVGKTGSGDLIDTFVGDGPLREIIKVIPFDQLLGAASNRNDGGDFIPIEQDANVDSTGAKLPTKRNGSLGILSQLFTRINGGDRRGFSLGDLLSGGKKSSWGRVLGNDNNKDKLISDANFDSKESLTLADEVINPETKM